MAPKAVTQRVGSERPGRVDRQAVVQEGGVGGAPQDA
jgi:hypothetical protein